MNSYDLNFTIDRDAADNGKIYAIKALRTMFGYTLGLRDAKDIVEMLITSRVDFDPNGTPHDPGFTIRLNAAQLAHYYHLTFNADFDDSVNFFRLEKLNRVTGAETFTDISRL